VIHHQTLTTQRGEEQLSHEWNHGGDVGGGDDVDNGDDGSGRSGPINALVDAKEEEEVDPNPDIGRGKRPARGGAGTTLSSRFQGVTWINARKKWRAYKDVMKSGRYTKVNLGMHVHEDDAARAVTEYVEHGTIPACVRKPSSKLRGVIWNKQNKKWRAAITDKGKTTYIDNFDTEKQAALAYNAAARRMGRPASQLNVISDDDDAADDRADSIAGACIALSRECAGGARIEVPHQLPISSNDYKPSTGAVHGSGAYLCDPPSDTGRDYEGDIFAPDNAHMPARPTDLGIVTSPCPLHAGDAVLELPPTSPTRPRPLATHAVSAALHSIEDVDCMAVGAVLSLDVLAASRGAAKSNIQTRPMVLATAASSTAASTLKLAAMEARIHAVETKGEVAIAEARVKAVWAIAKAELAAARAELAEEKLHLSTLFRSNVGTRTLQNDVQRDSLGF
jgi:hypothetical protein